MSAKKKSIARRGALLASVADDQRGCAQGRTRLSYEGAEDEIGRAHILRKYWELANLDPEITKGTITGQLKALDSLCGELGLAPATQERERSGPDKTKGAAAIYRSAWNRTAGEIQDGE